MIYVVDRCTIVVLHGSILLELFPEHAEVMMKRFYDKNYQINKIFAAITKCENNVVIKLIELTRRFFFEHKLETCVRLRDQSIQIYRQVMKQVIDKQFKELRIDIQLLRNHTYEDIICDYFVHHKFINVTRETLEINPELKERYESCIFKRLPITENVKDIVLRLDYLSVVDELPRKRRKNTIYIDEPMTLDIFREEYGSTDEETNFVFVKSDGERMMSSLIQLLT